MALKLCTPAMIYLVISMFALLMIAFQNLGNFNVYCVGYYKCEDVNTSFMFLLKFLYIVLWTWILNLICESGNTTISWFLVLLPIVLFFVLIGLILTYRVSIYV